MTKKERKVSPTVDTFLGANILNLTDLPNLCVDTTMFKLFLRIRDLLFKEPRNICLPVLALVLVSEGVGKLKRKKGFLRGIFNWEVRSGDPG
jgi:hypothetical protein